MQPVLVIVPVMGVPSHPLARLLRQPRGHDCGLFCVRERVAGRGPIGENWSPPSSSEVSPVQRKDRSTSDEDNHFRFGGL